MATGNAGVPGTPRTGQIPLVFSLEAEEELERGMSIPEAAARQGPQRPAILA